MVYCSILFLFTFKGLSNNTKILQCLFKYFAGWNTTTAYFKQKIFSSQMDLMDHFWMSTSSFLSALRMTKEKNKKRLSGNSFSDNFFCVIQLLVLYSAVLCKYIPIVAYLLLLICPYRLSRQKQKKHPEQQQGLVMLLQVLGDLKVGLSHQKAQLNTLKQTLRALLNSLTRAGHGQGLHCSEDQRGILLLLQAWSFPRLTWDEPGDHHPCQRAVHCPWMEDTQKLTSLAWTTCLKAVISPMFNDTILK